MLKAYSGWFVALLLAIICAGQFYYRLDSAVTESYSKDELRYQAKIILGQQRIIYDLSGKYSKEELLRVFKKRCQVVKDDASGRLSADSMIITFEKGKLTAISDMNQQFLENLSGQ